MEIYPTHFPWNRKKREYLNQALRLDQFSYFAVDIQMYVKKLKSKRNLTVSLLPLLSLYCVLYKQTL